MGCVQNRERTSSTSVKLADQTSVSWKTRLLSLSCKGTLSQVTISCHGPVDLFFPHRIATHAHEIRDTFMLTVSGRKVLSFQTHASFDIAEAGEASHTSFCGTKTSSSVPYTFACKYVRLVAQHRGVDHSPVLGLQGDLRNPL